MKYLEEDNLFLTYELAGGTEQEVRGLPLQTHFGAASR